jgi:hypothetical protein
LESNKRNVNSLLAKPTLKKLDSLIGKVQDAATGITRNANKSVPSEQNRHIYNKQSGAIAQIVPGHCFLPILLIGNWIRVGRIR